MLRVRMTALVIMPQGLARKGETLTLSDTMAHVFVHNGWACFVEPLTKPPTAPTTKKRIKGKKKP